MDDKNIAIKYLAKIQYCVDKKIEFNLSFYEFKRLITAKYCKYTGTLLTHRPPGKKNMNSSDVTIDRVDNKVGYVTGNVVACCHAYNSFKGVLEDPNNIIDFKILEKALKVQKKLQGGFN